MAWFSLTVPVLATVAVLFLPGAILLAPLRLRPHAWYAAAAPVSVALVSLAAMLAGLFGWGWQPLPVLGVTALGTAAVWLGRRLVRTRPAGHSGPDTGAAIPRDRRLARWTVAAAAVAAGSSLWLNTRIIARPDAFSQTFDNIFHLNAVRWILDTGNASSLQFAMTSGGARFNYYPVAWHDVISLALQIAGRADPVAGTNAMILVAGALVWPAGCLLLIRTLLPAQPGTLLTAGALTAAFGAHPFLLIGFGVLYPNWLALSLAPTALAFAVQFAGLASGERAEPRLAGGVLGLVTAGVALTHPNIAMMLVGLMMVLLAAWTLRAIAWPGASCVPAGRPAWPWRLAVLAGALAVAAIAWLRVRPPADAAIWLPDRTFPEGVGEALLVAPVGLSINLLLAPLVLAGGYAVLRTRTNRWLLVAHLFLVFLWLMAASGPVGPIRDLVVGIWYNDPPRLGAQLPVTALPLAVLGAHACLNALGDRAAAHLGAWARPLLAAGLAGSIAASALVGPFANRLVADIGKNYRLTAETPLLTGDEYTLLRRLPERVPADAVIATNPWNGSSMAYALTGRRTTTTHVLYTITPEIELINQHLDELASDPEVCPVLAGLNVEYVLDFGTLEVHGQRHPYRGFEQLQRAAGFELLDEQGRARLYRITGCG